MLSDRLIFGASSLAGLYKPLDCSPSLIIAAAVDAGFRVFDTAPHYGCGLGESRLGEALVEVAKAADAAVKIYTKVGRVMVKREEARPLESLTIEHGNVPGSEDCIFPEAPLDVIPVLDFTRRGIHLSHADSLKRLQVERVCGLRLHDIDCDAKLEEATRKGGDGGVEALVDLHARGLIDDMSIGVNDPVWAMKLLQACPPSRVPFNSIMIANSFNLLDHPVETLALFDICKERGMRVDVAGIFASGVLAGGDSYRYSTNALPLHVQERLDGWKTLCSEYQEISLGQAALDFCLSFESIDMIAVGLKSVEEILQIKEWFEAPRLPREFWLEARARGLIDEHVCAHAGMARIFSS